MQGPDAQDFLHRLSTVDVKNMKPGHGQRGFFLTPQGRVQAYFTLRNFATDLFVLEFDAGADGSWKKRLLETIEYFRFNEKFTLEDDTERLECFWIVSPQGDFVSHWGEKAPDLPEMTLLEWEACRVENGIPWIDQEITTASNPLDLGLRDGISDQKGCYPGQEVIEKIISLGSPSKRLVQIETDQGSKKLAVVSKTKAQVGMKSELGKILKIFTILGALLLCPPTQAQYIWQNFNVSPYKNYHTIESEHFSIHFDLALHDVAKKTATYLEEAHRYLSPRLLWQPRQKTQVLLLDNTDSANGAAAAVLRMGLYLYVTPPDNWLSLNNYDNWLRLVCFHEYTHILNMDPTLDWIEALRVVFGDVIRPNALWTTWMLEGLAVYSETMTSNGGGRGRSTYYDMFLRAGIADQFTPDRMNTPYPYFPSGEVPYFFGYHLMNQVAKKQGYESLAKMSIASAARVPFFINGNLENITGHDWFYYWDEWMRDSKQHVYEQIEKIKSQPVTETQEVFQEGIQVLGSAASPNGEWLAVTVDGIDHRWGLYLHHLKTKERIWIDDKLDGASLSWSPDSRFLVYSALKQQKTFDTFSELYAYNLKNHDIIQLTEYSRSKDPSVNYQGNQVAFTSTQNGTIRLAVASIDFTQDEPVLGKPQILVEPPFLGRISNPKFSPDGKKIVFSQHDNQTAEEKLMEYDLVTQKTTVLLSNGHYNKWPVFSPKSELYFVSDLTGVDNLYRLEEGKPVQVTNMLTALWFPSFDPQTNLYGAVLGQNGWQLARLNWEDRPTQRFVSDAITVPHGSAPEIVKFEAPPEASVSEPTKYSAWPTMKPRYWAPILAAGSSQIYAGGEVVGFDALELHNYTLGAYYESLTQRPYWFVQYTNRQLGPPITVSNSDSISYLSYNSQTGNGSYIRLNRTRASTFFPFQGTWDVLRPSLAFNLDQEFGYLFTPNSLPPSPYTSIPSFDAQLYYSNAETSRLAISSEGGRAMILGLRSYFEPTSPVVKSYFSWNEWLRLLSNHFILAPQFIGSATNRMSTFNDSNVVVKGQVPQPFDTESSAFGSNLTSVAMRGYPGQSYVTRAVLQPSAELRFPLARIFRGWETQPLYLQNAYGFFFGETSYFPNEAISLPSAGGGLRLDMEAFLRVPLTASVEYHWGANSSLGGVQQFIATIYMGGLGF